MRSRKQHSNAGVARRGAEAQEDGARVRARRERRQKVGDAKRGVGRLCTQKLPREQERREMFECSGMRQREAHDGAQIEGCGCADSLTVLTLQGYYRRLARLGRGRRQTLGWRRWSWTASRAGSRWETQLPCRSLLPGRRLVPRWTVGFELINRPRQAEFLCVRLGSP